MQHLSDQAPRFPESRADVIAGLEAMIEAYPGSSILKRAAELLKQDGGLDGSDDHH